MHSMASQCEKHNWADTTVWIVQSNDPSQSEQTATLCIGEIVYVKALILLMWFLNCQDIAVVRTHELQQFFCWTQLHQGESREEFFCGHPTQTAGITEIRLGCQRLFQVNISHVRVTIHVKHWGVHGHIQKLFDMLVRKKTAFRFVKTFTVFKQASPLLCPSFLKSRKILCEIYMLALHISNLLSKVVVWNPGKLYGCTSGKFSSVKSMSCMNIQM